MDTSITAAVSKYNCLSRTPELRYPVNNDRANLLAYVVLS